MAESSTLLISELFHSIQGESTWAGYPCSFIRLAGCDVNCSWCDTPHSLSAGTPMELDEVMSWCEQSTHPIFEITGGEPLLQEAVYPFMEALLRLGRPLLLETSGTVDISRVPGPVYRIVDLKPPGSGQVHRNLWQNLSLLTKSDEVKCVISDRRDYDWSVEAVTRRSLVERTKAVTFSPVQAHLEPSVLAEWLLEDALPIRLGLQLHRVIWPNQTVGR